MLHIISLSFFCLLKIDVAFFNGDFKSHINFRGTKR
jgi:hypothetical protein